jgi:tRNA 2-thiouridine synthesizing protein D
MKLGILVTTAPYTFQNIDTAYHLAKAALDLGHEVLMFLYMDGVINANKNIRSPGERNVADMLRELAGLGVRIEACGECAKFRGIKRDQVVEGTRLTGISTLAEMVNESDRFVTLGF